MKKGNWIFLISCFLGCFIYVSNLEGDLLSIVARSIGLYLAFQSTMLFVVREICD